MTSVSVLVIAICNVLWLMSVIIALTLLRALARREKSTLPKAPVERYETIEEPARERRLRGSFIGAHASMLAEIPAGIGRLFQPHSTDPAPVVVPSDPARD